MDGGDREFGSDTLYLFLSGDLCPPEELIKIKACCPNRIGFISWKEIISILKRYRDALGSQFNLLIDEFLTFATNYRLGRIKEMTPDDLQKFVEQYRFYEETRQYASDYFNEILKNLLQRIILDSEERIRETADDCVSELPSLYTSFGIVGWPIKNGYGYVFLNLITQKAGFLFNGYQKSSPKEIKAFQTVWDTSLKIKYAEMSQLCAFTWMAEGDDELAIKGGYFKLIDGTSGKIFNPLMIPDLSSYFYWGAEYHLNLDSLDSLYVRVASDFRKALDHFSPET